MFGLPSGYALLGAVVGAMALAIGAFFYGEHIDNLAWQAEVAAQKVEAQQQLSAAQATVDAKQKALDDLNLQSEHDHAEHQKALVAKDADLQRVAAQLDSLRQSRRGNGGNSPLSSNAVAATVPAAGTPPDAGADPGSFQVLVGLASDTIDVAEYARQCHDWVTSIGTIDTVKAVSPTKVQQ